MVAKTTAPSKKVQAPQTPLTALQQQSMRNFLIISIGITVLVVAIGGYLSYRLATANVKKALEVRAQDYYISLAKTKKSQLDEADRSLASLKGNAVNGTSDFDYVTKRVLPENDDFESILTVFNTLETKQLVSIDSISKVAAVTSSAIVAPSASNNAGGAKSEAISIKATGAKEQIIGFLEAIETSARVFNFSTMKLSGEDNKITLDMQYEIYYLPKPDIKDTTMPLNQFEDNKASLTK